MRVFVTGATGFVGSAVVEELLKREHTVLGLVRSDESARKLKAAGGEPLQGIIEDLDILKRGASQCDGAIHLAFNHDDFSQYEKSCADDLKTIETIGEVFAGTGKPFVVTSGVLGLTSRPISTEDEMRVLNNSFPRAMSEIRTINLASKGIRSSVVRLPPTIHGDGDKGFITMLINIAKKKGVSAYVGDGAQRWPAGHRLDAAKLFVLALEKGIAGSNYHAVGEQGVAIKDIAELIGRKLNVPVVSKSLEEAREHFGFLAWPLGMDGPTSSEKTQKEFGWIPTHVGLLEDMEKGTYFKA